MALALAERQPGAAKVYAEHEAALAAAKSDLVVKSAAAKQASELDQKVARERVEMLRNADPDDLMIGLSALDCCDGCSETECMIAPGVGRCAHPRKGGLPLAYHNDRVLHQLQGIAREEIAALERGDYDDDDADEQGEAA
ncbi:hypothetical protein IVA98_32930 [Bradyrhizobium sp. 160]|uniref:hypothetical protein n=1 Tax=unclassified Bradyrhizobium TaxID=2631580 RepID=UPI001FF8040A|nr:MULTISPECIES: hypothetical protein [unclassified Bradyrhizobium]MCK1542206.1 hypothetical protein [Bradyrhizobium sp. 179]MCK1627834.1 hypothetical protein [Bradyrhizobium sp. 160]